MDDSGNERLLNDESTFQGNLATPPNLGHRASETLPINSRQRNNVTPYVPQSCSSYEDDIVSHESDMDSDPIKNAPTAGKPSLKVYKLRWIIMGIFCLLCVMEDIVWNTWGPIAITAENYFHWGNDDIAELNNWGNINVLVFILPAVWLLDSKGVRVTVIVAAFLLFLSTGVRCITFENPYALWMMNAGQFLNGISLIITLITPAILSTLWFPLKERVTAVSIISFACNLGITLSFLVGMSLHDIGPANSTHHHHLSLNSSNPLTKMTKINHTASTRERDGKDIRIIMYSEFGICVLIFIIILCYFPTRPKLPPSKSASFSRPKSSVELKELVRNRNVWLFCLSTGLTYGVIGNFIGLLALVLKPLNVNQRQAQFMGIYGQLVATFFPIAVGKIADRYNKSLKLILGFFWLVMVASSITLLLIALKVIANYIALIYFLTVVINGFLAICYPLSWQLGCEITYPASEGLTLGLMYFFQNIVATVFLLLFKIPNIGTIWVLYCMSGSSIFGFLLFTFIKVEYRRLQMDSTSILDSNDGYGAINN